ncbi:hypothetical protein OH492_18215 [Vibrio chagasii]|nr:hypothetical protein [Vibrio chagasii]
MLNLGCFMSVLNPCLTAVTSYWYVNKDGIRDDIEAFIDALEVPSLSEKPFKTKRSLLTRKSPYHETSRKRLKPISTRQWRMGMI